MCMHVWTWLELLLKWSGNTDLCPWRASGQKEVMTWCLAAPSTSLWFWLEQPAVGTPTSNCWLELCHKLWYGFEVLYGMRTELCTTKVTKGPIDFCTHCTVCVIPTGGATATCLADLEPSLCMTPPAPAVWSSAAQNFSASFCIMGGSASNSRSGSTSCARPSF